MEKVIKRHNINWSTLGRMLQFDVDYDEERDILLMHSKDNRPAVSIDCDGEYWLRVDPQTGDIVGVEIEDFKSVFLKKHPKLSKANTAYVRPIADHIQLERCPV